MSEPIAIVPVDYWRLKARLAKVRAMRAELRAAILEQQAVIDAIAIECQLDYDAMATKYQFDPKGPWDWDDETTSIRTPDAP